MPGPDRPGFTILGKWENNFKLFRTEAYPRKCIMIIPDFGSSIEGEYVPLPGDEVKYKLCPIPPKYEKNQAINVQIVNLTPEVHLRWDCPVSEEESECHGH